MGEVERVSIECPKCHAVCKVKPTEYEPWLGSFHCEACGVYGVTNDVPTESPQTSTEMSEEEIQNGINHYYADWTQIEKVFPITPEIARHWIANAFWNGVRWRERIPQAFDRIQTVNS